MDIVLLADTVDPVFSLYRRPEIEIVIVEYNIRAKLQIKTVSGTLFVRDQETRRSFESLDALVLLVFSHLSVVFRRRAFPVFGV